MTEKRLRHKEIWLMRDRKRFHSFVSGSGCDWGCEDGFSLDLTAGGCPSSGSDCMNCWIICEI